MRIIWAIGAVIFALGCLGCSAGSGGTMPVEQEVDGVLHATLPGQFDSRQGTMGWSYCAAPVGTVTTVPLLWQATAGAAPNAEPCWTESSGACVGQTWLRPGNAREVILVWEARALGNAECAFTLQGRQSGGDGALVSIVHNGARISGPQPVPNTPQSQTIIALHAVTPGDRIAFCVAPRAKYEDDWFTYQARVTVAVRP